MDHILGNQAPASNFFHLTSLPNTKKPMYDFPLISTFRDLHEPIRTPSIALDTTHLQVASAEASAQLLPPAQGNHW